MLYEGIKNATTEECLNLLEEKVGIAKVTAFKAHTKPEWKEESDFC